MMTVRTKGLEMNVQITRREKGFEFVTKNWPITQGCIKALNSDCINDHISVIVLSQCRMFLGLGNNLGSWPGYWPLGGRRKKKDTDGYETDKEVAVRLMKDRLGIDVADPNRFSNFCTFYFVWSQESEGSSLRVKSTIMLVEITVFEEARIKEQGLKNRYKEFGFFPLEALPKAKTFEIHPALKFCASKIINDALHTKIR